MPQAVGSPVTASTRPVGNAVLDDLDPDRGAHWDIAAPPGFIAVCMRYKRDGALLLGERPTLAARA
jgi:hypothetical protein